MGGTRTELKIILKNENYILKNNIFVKLKR